MSYSNVFFAILGNLNYILIISAFLFRDIFYLRALTLLSSLCALSYYYYYAEHPLWINFSWECVFITVNLVQIFILLYEAYAIRLTPDEEALFLTAFHKFKPAHLKRLLKNVKYMHSKRGDIVIQQGEKVKNVMIITQGLAEIEVNNKIIAWVRPGNFIGEMSFISQAAATATVRVVEDLRYAEWSQEELRELLEKEQEMKTMLQETFSHDLVKKLYTRPSKIGREELPLDPVLFQTVFPNISAKNCQKLLENGKFFQDKKGEILIRQGEQQKKLIALCKGSFDIEISDKIVAQCHPGNFVGEMSFVIGFPSIASATVHVAEDASYIEWESDVLLHLFEEDPNLKAEFFEILSHEIMKKIQQKSSEQPKNS